MFLNFNFCLLPFFIVLYQSMAAKNEEEEKQEKFHVELVRQMLALATSGFGLVAALAWNSVVQEFVNNYIKKYLPSGSGIWSLLIYAVVVTALAVFITYELSRLLRRLGAKNK